MNTNNEIILVTGVAGFIGSALTKRLLKKRKGIIPHRE